MKPLWWIIGTCTVVLGVSAAYLVFEGPVGREAIWYPDHAAIAALEETAQKAEWERRSSDNPERPIAEYARYYLGTMFEGRRIIEGEFVFGWPDYKKGVHIVKNENEMPFIFDGGCFVVRITFDADAELITSIKCNGLA